MQLRSNPTSSLTLGMPSQFLTEEELASLHSEQLALVDFLVLTAGRRFVGFEVTRSASV